MQATTSNSDLDKQFEFLRKISDIKVKLFRPGIESEFPNEAQKKRFKSFRLQWSMFVEQVEIDIATILVDQLEQNESNFENGIRAINQKIQAIEDTVGFLDLLGRVLAIVGRIVRLGV